MISSTLHHDNCFTRHNRHNNDNLGIDDNDYKESDMHDDNKEKDMHDDNNKNNSIRNDNKDHNDATEFVQYVVDNMVSSSQFLRKDLYDEYDDERKVIPIFSQDELDVGKQPISRGSLSYIHNIKSFRRLTTAPEHFEISNNKTSISLSVRQGIARELLMKSSRPSSTTQKDHARSKIKKTEETSTKNRTNQFVIKYVIPKLLENDPQQYAIALAALTKEAHFLASVDHPNLLNLKGISFPSADADNNFFIVLDKLSDTLNNRIDTWKNERSERRKNAIRSAQIIDMSRDFRRRQRLLGRLQIASSITNALSYLHNKNVMHRDIKPENIGFDLSGCVKVFDFGLAKEVLPSSSNYDRDYNETYRLTGNIGSFRYMAPEVALSQDYGFKADVYSFTIILYEMLTLHRPYENYDDNKYMKFVVNGKKRPKFDFTRCDVELRELINEGWSANPEIRPSFREMFGVLKEQYHLESKVNELGWSYPTSQVKKSCFANLDSTRYNDNKTTSLLKRTVTFAGAAKTSISSTIGSGLDSKNNTHDRRYRRSKSCFL